VLQGVVVECKVSHYESLPVHHLSFHLFKS